MEEMRGEERTFPRIVIRGYPYFAPTELKDQNDSSRARRTESLSSSERKNDHLLFLLNPIPPNPRRIDHETRKAL
jgi:hypothetical protein